MATVLLEHLHPVQHRASHRRLALCHDCGRLSDEHELTCQCCSSEGLELVPHFGEIYSYTVVHQDSGSFVLALIRLTGGSLVTARIHADGHDLRIGLRVQFEANKSESVSRGLFFSPMGITNSYLNQ